MRTFEQAIEKKTADKQCLYNLEQYTRGQPRKLVQSCYNMAAGQGYVRAKNLLKEYFGNEMNVSAAYIETAMHQQWNLKIQKLHTRFSIFLRECCNVMEDLEHMEEMNVPSNLCLMMMKLPYKLREKWRTVAYELQENCGYRAMFPDLVAFVEHQMRFLLDLVGDLQGSQPILPFKAKPRHTGRGQDTVAAVTTAEQNPSLCQYITES